MKILVIGSGGREHTLVHELFHSAHQPTLLVAPGNAGMESLISTSSTGETSEEPRLQRLEIDPTDIQGLCLHAQREGVNLTVVGPEAPLAAGIVDTFQKVGLSIFGPSKAAAQLEASKRVAKKLMQEATIPTAQYRYCEDPEKALQEIQHFQPPYVVKEDGLAGGKGVTVTESRPEAEAAIQRAITKNMPVVLESFLEGQELSVMALCDGKRALPLCPAQDFKRVGEGNTGPNTGGMGAYAPVPFVNDALMAQIQHTILDPTLQAMARRGTPFSGVLYAGLMISSQGTPSVVEFNVRFGDPETQVVLPLLDTDLVDLLMASATGDLSPYAETGIPFKKETSAVTVVLASQGYPGSYETGKPITLPALSELPLSIRIFHAGTRRTPQQKLITHGGRVLNVTGLGPTIAEARQAAYTWADAIQFENKFVRQDIAQEISQNNSQGLTLSVAEEAAV